MTRIEERNGWRIKTSGSSVGRPIAAEYICLVHGKFDLDVARDEEGDPPEWVACPKPVAGGCCGEPAEFAISAPRVKVRLVEVVRGGYEKAEFPTWTNTENLGEGQEYDDWVADRDKVWERDREDSIKELIDG